MFMVNSGGPGPPSGEGPTWPPGSSPKITPSAHSPGW